MCYRVMVLLVIMYHPAIIDNSELCEDNSEKSFPNSHSFRKWESSRDTEN